MKRSKRTTLGLLFFGHDDINIFVHLLIGWRIERPEKIVSVEELNFSFQTAMDNLIVGLSAALSLGLTTGLMFGLSDGLSIGLITGLMGGLIGSQG